MTAPIPIRQPVIPAALVPIAALSAPAAASSLIQDAIRSLTRAQGLVTQDSAARRELEATKASLRQAVEARRELENAMASLEVELDQTRATVAQMAEGAQIAVPVVRDQALAAQTNALLTAAMAHVNSKTKQSLEALREAAAGFAPERVRGSELLVQAGQAALQWNRCRAQYMAEGQQVSEATSNAFMEAEGALMAALQAAES
jgi:hypothetical protein